MITIFIFILVGFVLAFFIAFLIYSMFYPEVISKPLIILERFNSYRLILKQKKENYLILKHEQSIKEEIPIKNNLLVKSIDSKRSKSPELNTQDATIENTIFLSGGVGGFIEVLGESHYQLAIKEAKKHSDKGKKYFELYVGIEHEPTNKYDSNAIRVHFLDQTLGYLSRDDAKVFLKSHKEAVCDGRPILCQGYLTGGIVDKPSMGVMLSFDIFDEKRRKTWGITVNNQAVRSKTISLEATELSRKLFISTTKKEKTSRRDLSLPNYSEPPCTKCGKGIGESGNCCRLPPDPDIHLLCSKCWSECYSDCGQSYEFFSPTPIKLLKGHLPVHTRPPTPLKDKSICSKCRVVLKKGGYRFAWIPTNVEMIFCTRCWNRATVHDGWRAQMDLD